jgi:hypothetical protein
MDPADFYGIRGVSFTGLRRELGWLSDAPHPEEERLSRAIGSALLHGDDPDRLRALAAGAAHPGRTRAACVVDAHRPAVWRQELRQLLELLAARADHRLHPLPWALPVPLRGRALARTQPVRPAVRHPQEERSPLLPHHPLPRPGCRHLWAWRATDHAA